MRDSSDDGALDDQQQLVTEVKTPFESDEIAVWNQTDQPQRFALCMSSSLHAVAILSTSYLKGTIDPEKFEADTFSPVIDLNTRGR